MDIFYTIKNILKQTLEALTNSDNLNSIVLHFPLIL
jgi:hypothetical protein